MAIYVKYGDIKGNATHDKHKEWLDVQSLQWSVNRSIATKSGSSQNREASEPSLSEVSLFKEMDAASPKLLTEACTGAAGKKVEIHLVSTGSPGVTYAEYELTNGLISSYSMSSSGDRPTESLTISFTKIQFKYTPYDDKHKAGDPITVSYDVSSTKSG
jgi:type VI secretion system secreted protein Hcp